jgi:hypothetical protein
LKNKINKNKDKDKKTRSPNMINEEKLKDNEIEK